MAGSLSSSLNKMVRECQSYPRKLIEESAKTLTKATKKTLARDTGGDSSLSGAPAKLKVRSKVEGDSVVTATIEAGPKKSMAMWSWLEYGTNPHVIRKGQTIYSPAKRTWTKAVDPEIKKLLEDAEDKFLNLFRG